MPAVVPVIPLWKIGGLWSLLETVSGEMTAPPLLRDAMTCMLPGQVYWTWVPGLNALGVALPSPGGPAQASE